MQTGTLRIRARFGVVDNLAVELLLEPSYTNKFICRIAPAKRKFVLWLLRPVYIIVPTTEASNAAVVAGHFETHIFTVCVVDDLYHKLFVAKAVMKAPYTLTPVLVNSAGSGTVLLKPVYVKIIRAPPRASEDLVNVTLYKQFHVTPTNMSENSVKISVHLIVPQAWYSPTHFTVTDAVLLKSDTKTAFSGRYKSFVGKDIYIKRHIEA